MAHYVADVNGKGSFRPYYARWSGGAWSEPEHLFGSDRSGKDVGLAAGGDRVYLAVGALDIPGGPYRGVFLSSRPVRGAVAAGPDPPEPPGLSLGPPRPNPARGRVALAVRARQWAGHG